MSWLEFFCCYSNQYSLRSLLRRSQKKCIPSHNRKTSHFSGIQRMFPYMLHPLMIHREATPGKFSVYSPYAVPSFVFLEDTLDFRGYIRISLLNFICFSDLIIIGRLRQLHRCQQIFQGISFFSEFFDKRCFFALSCAAHLSSLKALSFFMTAFSASRYSILALSRIISSRSEGVNSAGSIFFFI